MLLPLNIAGGEPEANEDTSAPTPRQHKNDITTEKNQTLTIRHALQERPDEARKLITDGGHSE